MLIRVRNKLQYAERIRHYESEGHPPYVARTLAFRDVGPATRRHLPPIVA